MEGKGAYNRYAKLPAGGAALALPLLEEAVRSLELDSATRLGLTTNATETKDALATKHSLFFRSIFMRICARLRALWRR